MSIDFRSNSAGASSPFLKAPTVGGIKQQGLQQAANAQTIAQNRIQAMQAQIQGFGTPVGANASFMGHVAEKTAMMTPAPQRHAFKSDLSQKLYPSKSPSIASSGILPNPNAALSKLFADDTETDYSARFAMVNRNPFAESAN